MDWLKDHALSIASALFGALAAWFTLKARVDALNVRLKSLEAEVKLHRRQNHDIRGMIADDRAEIYFLKKSREEDQQEKS